MNKLLPVTIGMISLFILLTSFYLQENSVGSIGDVKYSMLNKSQFEQENGSGWVLMDGRSIEGSDYHRITGFDKVPDARNNFIRGMGGEYDKADGVSATGLKRAVGSFQECSTQLPKISFVLSSDTDKHKHENYRGGIHKCDGGKRGMADDYWTNKCAKPQKTYTKEHKRSHTHKLTGGDPETRPQNITLYTYIKINQ